MKKKIYRPSKFMVKRPLYLHVNKKIDEKKTIETESIYKLWECNFGVGNPSFLILTNHIKELPLGDIEKCLIEPSYEDLANYFATKGFPRERLVEKLCNILNFKPTLNNDKTINIPKTMLGILSVGKIYKTTLPIKNEYLKHLLEKPNKLQEQIELFLSEGCKKDPKLLFWGKSRLIRTSDDLDDYWMERYRGHALVIKNPKSGFSYLAQKLGRDIGYASAASIRGFADSQGNIRHGVYHAHFGSVVLDEASRYKEIVSDVAMNFMELGKQEVTTAAYNLTNLGAPVISVVLNPGLVTASPRDMLEAIDKVLPSLTTTPEAFGSRFGLVIFSNKLKQVVQTELIPIEQAKENELIVESIFELAIPNIKNIYRDERVQAWLNKPQKTYEDEVRKLVDKFEESLMFGKRCNIFWLDQITGYRHMRGFALEVALVDNIAEIIKADFISDELVDVIFESAEEHLQTVISINLDSLREMVATTKEGEDVVKDIIISRYEGLKGYKKGMIFSYALGLAEKKISLNTKFTTFDELGGIYNEVDMEKLRELFGKRYSLGFSTVIQAFNKLTPEAKNQICRELETKFGLEVSYSDNQRVWVINRVGDTVVFLLDYVKELIE